MANNNVAAPVAQEPVICTSLSNDEFKCEVQIESKAVEVYGAGTNGNLHSGYIISEEGKRFAVVLEDKRVNPLLGLSYDVLVDGEKVSDGIVRRVKGQPAERTRISGMSIGNSQFAPFVFSSLKVTDDDSETECNESAAFNQNVGTIEFKVRRAKITGRGTKEKALSKSKAKSERKKVIHEEKKGMVSHVMSWGPTEPVRGGGQTYFNCEEIDTDAAPYRIFKFYYRSRALLELQSIIPSVEVEQVEEQHEPVAGPGPKTIQKQREVIVIPSSSQDEADQNQQDSDDEQESLLQAEQAKLAEKLAELEKKRELKRGVEKLGAVKVEGEKRVKLEEV